MRSSETVDDFANVMTYVSSRFRVQSSKSRFAEDISLGSDLRQKSLRLLIMKAAIT